VDIKAGLTIDDPPVTVRWGISESELQTLMGPTLHCVTAGYWTSRVQVLGGLKCRLGFHFDKKRRALEEFEFFRDSCPDQKASFAEFQRFFEAAFGRPTETRSGTGGFASHSWRLGPVEIEHYVFDRFGPEERLRIRRSGFLRAFRKLSGAVRK
jgi:hypothetical protein